MSTRSARSGFLSDLRDVGGGLTDRTRRLRSQLARMTLVPVLVRLWVWLAAAAATLLAWPADLLARGPGVFLLGVAALPALAPRTAAVTVAALVSAGGWLVTTTAYAERIVLWRLVALAAALYLLHSAAALAAQLPYDAIVSPAVLVRWLGRAGLVVAGTALVAVYALVAADLLSGRAFAVATLAGLTAAVGVAALLSRLTRR